MALGIRAHEWGVWKIRRGRIEHLEALAAETPAFVFREGRPGSAPPPPPIQPPFPGPLPPRPPFPPRPPGPIGPGPVARKPILFLYANQSTDVTVRVGFRGGEPWLWYPSAMQTSAPEQDVASQALTWTGRLAANGRAPLAAVPRGHWWNDLRRVGAGTFISRTDQTAERFLFYDGPVAFEPTYRIENTAAGPRITPLTQENEAWIARGDMRLFRRTLERALMARGLTRAETRSLLETWRDELFRSSTPRVVYLVPRATYDRMLPIRISPQPTELVRVGLVIEELDAAALAANP